MNDKDAIGFWRLISCFLFVLVTLCVVHIAHLQTVSLRTPQSIGSVGIAGAQEEEATGSVASDLEPPLEIPTFPAEGPLDYLLQGDSLSPDAEGGDERGDLPGGGALCNDVHPNADSPDMLHVVYASDASQVEGIQASLASVVEAAASPDELTVHIMVQGKLLRDFKERFGLRQECQGAVTETGVLIRIHAVDGQAIEKAVAKVSASLKKQRGAIDTLENFARFYMHLILGGSVVIYLDADTIVQADLGILRKKLIASGKTIGFVARAGPIYMDKFLKSRQCSGATPESWEKLLQLPAYNVGVLAINLQRWLETGAVLRIEELVAKHNACGGQFWIGGSQPPLLLAFLGRPEEDYMVFDAAWNAVDLGWSASLSTDKLKKQHVLHWNGNLKPWLDDGLYRELWLPHRERFKSLLRPYESKDDSRASFRKTPQEIKPLVRPTTISPEEAAALAACPSVRLIDEWTEASKERCMMSKSYGCSESGRGMWTAGSCSGLFSVSGAVTACGKADFAQAACAPGALPAPRDTCGLMIMTSFFTTKKDWQRDRYTRPSFSKIRVLYRSIIRHGMNVTVIYDRLPEEIIQRYTCDRFQFVRVDFSRYNEKYGVNDVRYFFFLELVQAHEEWRSVFIIDAFDVRVVMNPCTALSDDVLYVGSELNTRLRQHPWIKARFKKMGGTYNEWYQSKVTDNRKIVNCGITGGRRSVMLTLLKRMTEVLSDPDLSVRRKNEDINLNMAALNYIVYTDFAGNFATGPPLHSVYKRYETRRTDVWFIHK